MIRLLILCCCAFVGGCGSRDAPPLEITEVSIFAPLPGSKAAVAYFELQNNSGGTIVVETISSPDFGRVELHESRLENGISRMAAIDTIDIAPGRRVMLAEGGKHVMLMGPRVGLDLGQPVTLLIGYGNGSEVVVRSTLKPRVTLDVN